MRDFHLPGRSAAFGVNGMAATSHPLSTMAAVDVLRSGGNAVDAAVAAAAVQAVVEPQSTGIGGDCFVLHAPASGGVVALNGSGAAPVAASVEALRDQGLTKIPQHSAHSVTVPGAIGAWEAILQSHGTRELGTLLQPAIEHAENGFAVTPRVAFDWKHAVRTLEVSEAGAAAYLPAGKAPMPGRVMRFPLLAQTLRTVAEGGAEAFYRGELAAKMVASLHAHGGLHSEEDFADAQPEFVDPIHTNYRDYRVYQCPPNGQGVVALLMLNILENFEAHANEAYNARRLHRLAEAAKLAYRDRDAVLSDPNMTRVPTSKLLDKAYGHELAQLIDDDRAITDLPPPLLDEHPDTVYISVVDRDLNAVSFINSLYDGFGSGIVCPETGVLFHCRGRAFRLEHDHPNRIEGGKRPVHTIIPGLAFKGGEVWMSYGVMGGEYQPVGHAHLLTNMIDYGIGVQLALDAPRIMPYPRDLDAERGLPAAVRAGLQERGHAIFEPRKPLGGGQAIVIDRKRGVLVGGSDPRKDGIALGY